MQEGPLLPSACTGFGNTAYNRAVYKYIHCVRQLVRFGGCYASGNSALKT